MQSAGLQIQFQNWVNHAATHLAVARGFTTPAKQICAPNCSHALRPPCNANPTQHVNSKKRRARTLQVSLKASLADVAYEDEELEDWDTVWVDEFELLEDEDKPTGKRLPAEMRCFDTASIFVKAGDGGNGCVAFRREKFVAKGGPSGGNGGVGGHVWAVVDPSLNSLRPFRRQVHFRAKDGSNGSGSQMNGANGEDILVRVPPGTVIRKKGAGDDEPPVAELLKEGDKALLTVGGKGGRGNASFKSSTNKAPQLAEKGELGAEGWLELELKLVADVGIIGVPNAGKSTLLSVISAAKPKIANYPFTTLTPNLGVCEMDFTSTLFADIPGLLEGAHTGVGLGHQFLRHVQRCRVLVHVIDGTSPDPLGDYHAIRTELELFSPELVDKPQVIAYNKMDTPASSDYWEDVRGALVEEGIPEEDIVAISAVAGSGVRDLVRRTRALLEALPEGASTAPLTDALNVAEVPKPVRSTIHDFTVEWDSGSRIWRVSGESIAKFAQMTNWNYFEATKRFQMVLEAAGVNGALRKKGVKEGDTVVVEDMAFEWNNEQDDAALYSAWLDDQKAQGRPGQGSAHWPRKRG